MSGKLEAGNLQVRQFDYIVRRGNIYRIDVDDFNGGTYLVEVDEIPDEYDERWDEEGRP